MASIRKIEAGRTGLSNWWSGKNPPNNTYNNAGRKVLSFIKKTVVLKLTIRKAIKEAIKNERITPRL
jgi:hypothetical protein